MDTAEHTHHRAELPPAIATYQAAHDRRDVPTALAQFTPDAVVSDDGHTYEGTAGVEAFLRSAAAEYTFTRTLLGAEETGPDRWLVTNHIEGDFPGGTVDLRYEFRLTGGRIAQLTIAP
jgi:hypothetical protein